MHNFQQSKRLCPFSKFTHSTRNVLEADERNEENNSAKDGSPEDSANEIVDNQVLGLLAAVRSRSGVHCGRLVCLADEGADGVNGH